MKRIVLKVGSSLLSNSAGGLAPEKVAIVVAGIEQLRKDGNEVLLVSSGAISAGFPVVGYPNRPTSPTGKQAAAAVGQSLLMQAYTQSLAASGATAAQILLTRRDFSRRESYNNALNTINELLKRRIVPVINENDSIAIEELNFGDNDMLAALLAALVHADMLVLLTTTDGLYDRDPHKHRTAKRYDRLSALSPEIMAQAGISSSQLGTGGMHTKVTAAFQALALGVPAFIGRAESPAEFSAIIEGNSTQGTYIGEFGTNLKRKKQWIAFHAVPEGRLAIDAGAARAILFDQKSLLPAGITGVQGTFAANAVVELADPDNNIVGKGIVNYSSEQLKMVLGRSTGFVRETLGISKPEVIHRDNWAGILLSAPLEGKRAIDNE